MTMPTWTCRLVATLALLCSACEDERGDPPPPPPDPPEQQPPRPEPPAPDKADPDTEDVTGEAVPHFPGLYVPSGGKGGPPPHGGNSMRVYEYSMTRDELEKSARAVLDAHDWSIEQESSSPRGALRWVIRNEDDEVDFRIVGKGSQAALIVSRK